MKKSIVVILLFLLPIICFANGGIPYNYIENGSAKISLVNDKELILEKEDLTLKFEDDFVIVTCKYNLQNKSNKEKKINFAFNIPIEVGTYISEKYSLIYYHIFENEKQISFISKNEKNEDDPWCNSYNLWKISELSFSPKEEKTITIIYKQRSNTTSKIIRGEHSNNVFKYNLFPATSFGNGVIADFNLTIDKTDMMLQEGKIISISGIDIKDDKNNYVINKQFKNFDLNLNKELIIEYDINGFYIGSFIKNDWSYGNRFSVKATSELKENTTTYFADNLCDGDYTTPWVEASSDFGSKDKLSFTMYGNPEKFSSFYYKNITHLYLLNGFRKSEKTYYENNRVKKIRIVANGKSYGEYTLKDKPFNEINDFNFAYEADLIDLKNQLLPEKFDIEILEVYPGTKYNDTCISEIVILNVSIPRH